jgi:glucokinase
MSAFAIKITALDWSLSYRAIAKDAASAAMSALDKFGAVGVSVSPIKSGAAHA